MLETSSILLRSEDGDFIVCCAKGFHSFICLLAIVEGWCHAMDAKERVGDEFWGRPFSCFNAVVRFDVTVYCIGGVVSKTF